MEPAEYNIVSFEKSHSLCLVDVLFQIYNSMALQLTVPKPFKMSMESVKQ